MNAHEQMEQHIAAAARRFVSKAVAVAIDDGQIDDRDRHAAIVACLVLALQTHCMEAGFSDWRAYVVEGKE